MPPSRIDTISFGSQQDPASRAESGRVTVHGPDIVVLRQDPEPGKVLRGGMPVHGIMLPKPPPRSMRIALRIETGVGQVNLHGRLATFRPLLSVMFNCGSH